MPAQHKGADLPGPPFAVPANRVARVLQVFPEASTSPAEIETEDGTRFVLKFSGAGPGPRGLLTEYLALQIARAFGAPVPAAQPLYLRPDFPWMAGTDEFDSMLQRSGGWNLGIALIAGARAATLAEARSCATETLARIARADAFLQNMDRTAGNPNLLIGADGFRAIDFDACLYLTRALAPRQPVITGLPAGHLLRDLILPPRALPRFNFASMLADAPQDWLATTGQDRAGLATALGRYATAFGASQLSE